MNEVFLASQPGAFDISPHFCLKIASPASFQKAERYLLGTARKPTDGFFSRNFNRYISLFLTRRLVQARYHSGPAQRPEFPDRLMSVWFIGRATPGVSCWGPFSLSSPRYSTAVTVRPRG